MNANQSCTRQELADEMGISISTLARLAKHLNFVFPPGLICPKTRRKFLKAAGYLPDNEKQY